jgi:CBS domain-containing protein
MTEKRVEQIMRRRITSVGMEDTVAQVAAALSTHGLSCAPVIDGDGRCFGVISAPDLVHVEARGLKPNTLRAWEICTHKVICVKPDVTVTEAARLMVAHGIHHLVVTEDGTNTGAVAGIVSTLDLIEQCVLGGAAPATPA